MHTDCLLFILLSGNEVKIKEILKSAYGNNECIY